MNLDFLNEFKLKNKDLNEKLEFLIPDFLVKKAILLFMQMVEVEKVI